MNAYELANVLESMADSDKCEYQQSANMLRQQADRIAELEKQCSEPVAWMLTLPDGTHDWILDGNGCEGYIPLYTTPAKTLTDDEIEKVFFEIHGIEPAPSNVFEFARAILKKASEK